MKRHGVRKSNTIIKKTVTEDSKLVTDGFGGYKDLGGYFKYHAVLNHSKNIRKIGAYHTNNIEGFWTLLKRAIMGQYHKIEKHNLQGYLDEIAFKYNHRHSQNMFDTLLIRMLKPKYASI